MKRLIEGYHIISYFPGFSFADPSLDIVTRVGRTRQTAPWFICFAKCESVSRSERG